MLQRERGGVKAVSHSVRISSAKKKKKKEKTTSQWAKYVSHRQNSVTLLTGILSRAVS